MRSIQQTKGFLRSLSNHTTELLLEADLEAMPVINKVFIQLNYSSEDSEPCILKLKCIPGTQTLEEKLAIQENYIFSGNESVEHLPKIYGTKLLYECREGYEFQLKVITG